MKTQARKAKCLDFICSSATNFLDDRSQVNQVRFFFFRQSLCPPCICMKPTSPFRTLCRSPRSTKLQRNAAAYMLPQFPQAKGDDLVKPLNPCQQGFGSRSRQEHQSSCAALDQSPPSDGPSLAAGGSECPGRRAKSGVSRAGHPCCAFLASNHSRWGDLQS